MNILRESTRVARQITQIPTLPLYNELNTSFVHHNASLKNTNTVLAKCCYHKRAEVPLYPYIVPISSWQLVSARNQGLRLTVGEGERPTPPWVGEVGRSPRHPSTRPSSYN